MITFTRKDKQPTPLRYSEIAPGEFFRFVGNNRMLFLRLSGSGYVVIASETGDTVGTLRASSNDAWYGHLYIVDVNAEISDRI